MTTRKSKPSSLLLNRLSKKVLSSSEYPETYKGRVLDTFINLKHLLNTLNIEVRYNAMSRIREITIPDKKLFLDDAENHALNFVDYYATINEMPTKKLDAHLSSLAYENRYHPIVESILKTPWDTYPRLDDFIDTLKTTNPKFDKILIKKFLISSIAAIFSEKGFSAQGVLVLQGKQNIGKTSWVKSLDPLGCNAVKEGMLLDPANKDSVITCASYWIVELGELDGTFRRGDMARIKSHITNQMDNVRIPHAKKNSQFTRRTVYVATVNESNFLIDTTGNRRFWTVEVEYIDFSKKFDMQQVLAEAYYLWKEGASTHLDTEEIELLNIKNAEHEQIDPYEEKVLSLFDWVPDWRSFNTCEMTSSQVLSLVDCKNPTKSQATTMGNILRKLTKKKPVNRKHTLPRRLGFI